MATIQAVIQWISGDGILEFLQHRRWIIFVTVLAFIDYVGVVFTRQPHLTAAIMAFLSIAGALALGWAESKFGWNQYDEW